jgi:2-dehydro-3-deoxygluconokinase
MRALIVGEAMLELSKDGEGWRLGYGGDSLNTAIHLARAGIDTAFLTALGDDPFSHALKSAWQAESLNCELVLTHPVRQPGLYAITTDPAGERSFTYWRDASAAREMFTLPGIEQAMARAEHAELLYFSLITLAILPVEGRERLLALARRVRKGGGQVAFDGNYRARLWTSPEEAVAARDAAIGVADIGLPTLEDEAALSGEQDGHAVARHWRALGCMETVVKLGAHGCRLPDGQVQSPPRRLDPVDTSGAGDAFNGGYLAGRLAGLSVIEAARIAHELAGRVIMKCGAIPAIPEWPTLLETAS